MKNSIAKALAVKDGKTIVNIADLVIGMFADDQAIIKKWFTSLTGYRTYGIGIPNDEAFKNGFRLYCAIRGWRITDYEEASPYKRMLYAFHKMKEDLGLPKDAKASWKGWKQPKDDFSSLNPCIDEIYAENENMNVPGYDEEKEIQEGPRATLDERLVQAMLAIMYSMLKSEKIIIAQCDDKFINVFNIIEFEAANGFITQNDDSQLRHTANWLLKVMYDEELSVWLQNHTDQEIPDWEQTYAKLYDKVFDFEEYEVEYAIQVIKQNYMVK